MSRWFRFYDEVVNDPKVQMLEPELFRAWVNLLCLASKNDGVLPATLRDISFALRVNAEVAQRYLSELVGAGLLDDMGDCVLIPHNWNGRQKPSDRDPTNSDRQKRYRQNHNALRNGEVTALEEKREDKNRIDTEPNGSVTPANVKIKKKATRLHPHWKPTAQNLSDAKAKGLTDADIAKIEPRYRDHWLAAPGQRGVKLDWDATWRNWCDREAEKLGRSPPLQAGIEVAGQIHVKPDDPRWMGLSRRYMREKGKDPPLDRQGGWRFPADWLESLAA